MSETETSLERTAAVQALTDLVVATFALNGFPRGRRRPRAACGSHRRVVAGARRGPQRAPDGLGDHAAHGITRQSVQRVADVLVDREIAEYVDNPAHRTARLLQPLPRGRRAIEALVDEQTACAKRVLGAADVDVDELRSVLDVVTRLTASLLATGSAASLAA